MYVCAGMLVGKVFVLAIGCFVRSNVTRLRQTNIDVEKADLVFFSDSQSETETCSSMVLLTL